MKKILFILSIVVAATDGTVAGVGSSAGDALYRSTTVVDAFKIARK